MDALLVGESVFCLFDFASVINFISLLAFSVFNPLIRVDEHVFIFAFTEKKVYF